MFHVKPHSDKRDETHPLSSGSIQAALLEHGIVAKDAECAALSRHAELVLAANREFNLTRITESTDFLRLHIMDSALAAASVSAAPEGPLADLGSGPGYPGVVIALLTGRTTVLVESIRKKASLLEKVVGEVGVDATVYGGRAEELAKDQPTAFACVIARAVAPLPSLVELAAPLLFDGGRLVAMKSRPTDFELESGLAAARQCGMTLIRTLELDLSAEHKRTLVIYERTGSPRIALPRRTGLAQHSPLG